MFGIDFYPTTKETAREMFYSIGVSAFHDSYVIDPSAGDGALLTFVREYFANNNYKKPKALHGIEIDPNLRSILVGKGLAVVHDDFLTFDTAYNYDVIMMNPPFSEGARHLLKAWEIARNSTICCLLNRETLDNPYSQERQLLAKIIADNNGEVKQLGKCFKDAARQTDVEVAMVTLRKKTKESWQFDEGRFTTNAFQMPDDISSNMPALNDYFLSRENLAKARVQAALDVAVAFNKLKAMCGKDIWIGQDIEKLLLGGKLNETVDYMIGREWDCLLSQSDFKSKMTAKVKEQFEEKFKQQRQIAFTKQNMLELMEVLFQNQESIIQDCIIDTFDYLTAYYPENRVHHEGWKTNDKWMVGKKIILPYILSDTWLGNLHVSYDKERKLEDIDMALCHVAGKRISQIVTINKALKRAFDPEEYFKDLKAKHKEKWEQHISPLFLLNKGNYCESEFFKIRFFKKGTIHLEFKDEWVYQRFNQMACGGKGWLMGTDGQSFQRKQKRKAA